MATINNQFIATYVVHLYTNGQSILLCIISYQQFEFITTVMLLLIIVVTVILFAVLNQGSNGTIIIKNHQQWSGVNKNFSTYSNGRGVDPQPRNCIDNECSYPLLDHAMFNHLTSNILINITTDTELSSIIQLVDLDNVSILGHDNPTVKCNKHGGLRIVSCRNCTIEGITWEECGVSRNISNNNPVLQLYNSSNITIKNCSFQHSVGQAVAVKGVSGYVNIKHCNFFSNGQHDGHGTAIHYSSEFLCCSPMLVLTINNCNFSHNEGTASVIYFGALSTDNKLHEYLYLQNSNFHHNQGVPIYLSNQHLHISGRMEVCENNAENGGGIFISNHSTVVFHKNAKITFTKNTANSNGGAVFLTEHSSILFPSNFTLNQYHPHYVNTLHINEETATAITFDSNKAQYGGAIYAVKSNVIFGKETVVKFNGNEAFDGSGGALNVGDHSNITFEGNCKVSFTENEVYHGAGGAMHVGNCSTVEFEGNTVVTFEGNEAIYADYKFNGNGGAIYANNYSVITFKGNSVLKLSHNSAISSNGGAIYIDGYSTLTCEGDSRIMLNANVANYGGAVRIDGHSSLVCKGNSTISFNEQVNILYGGGLYVSQSYVTFQGTSRVIFNNNDGLFGGAVYINKTSNVAFSGNSAILFYNNRQGAIYVYHYSVVEISENSTINFTNNQNGEVGGSVNIKDNSVIVFKGKSVATFIHNGAPSGGSMAGVNNSTISFNGNSTITFKDNRALDHHGGAVYTDEFSTVTFEGDSIVLFIKDASASSGGAMYVSTSTVIVKENSTVKFNDNEAEYNGAFYIGKTSNVTFTGTSSISFYNNYAKTAAGTIGVYHYSGVTIEGESTVAFNNNIADGNGAAAYIDENSYVTFDENSTVTFGNNSVTDNGGAVYINHHSVARFKGNTTVTFASNVAKADKHTLIQVSNNGGAVYAVQSLLKFQEASTVTFSNNKADNHGGAIFNDFFTNVITEGDAVVVFYGNQAGSGGAMYFGHYSNITAEGDSVVAFNNNEANNNGGAVCVSPSYNGTGLIYFSAVSFKGNCNVTFYDNRANSNGGALFINGISAVVSAANSTITFRDNRASNNGGSLYVSDHSSVTFTGDSTVAFHSNKADINGGTAYVSYYSNITLQKNSIVTFAYNGAHNGGTIYSYMSDVVFQGNSTVVFNGNNATQSGGALYSYAYCNVIFRDNSTVTFIHNKAPQGAVMYSQLNSTVKFEGKCKVQFTENTAIDYGGVIHSSVNTLIKVDDAAAITFESNKAVSGGVIHCYNASVLVTGRSNVTFDSNSAEKGGGAIFTSSKITFAEDSYIEFTNNTALQDGGAIYFSDDSHFVLADNTKAKFYYSSAKDYGAAIYVMLKGSSITFDISDIFFKHNKAGNTNKSVYIDVPSSCNRICLFNNIKGISRKDANYTFPVATSPSKLILYNPTNCIHGNDTYCDVYYINNIMLGQEITFDACLVDYYNQPIKSAQFVVSGINHQHYIISGSKYISISCNHTTQGISVIGSLNQNNSYNYSIMISLYVIHISESKKVSVNLTVGLTQCHLGFQYSSELKKCKCYEANNIVSCSNSNSTIQRGYWFGSVAGRRTVTSCPNNYCNFTCCEITNGIYHLSPGRENQCRLHRSGAACGNCEEGYTLLFDSAECIEVSKCTSVQMILVVTLTVVYWIAIVMAMFVMMYFKVPTGSLYAIIYYYSIVDILLSQDYFISKDLYTTVNVMSSLAKLTPKFLGQLCFVRNMSGIDQQFIHYAHPTAVSLILVMIAMLARRSPKITSFISRGIIHFICVLLLLSYTSVAATSLLLMRSLKFVDVDKVYTYLSPDVEYFHGRHLLYIVVAAIFAIIIVIGLPLLLLLEPFLNARISFMKIKPLLDQFQGCYKGKYRYFAAYYMICRIVIIVLIKVSDDFTTQYLVISACALIALIHLIVQPYNSTSQNILDGIILQLIVIVSVLPIVEFVDSYYAGVIVIMAYLLIVLPFTSFVMINLLTNKKNIYNIIKQCSAKLSLRARNYHVIPHNEEEMPSVNHEEAGVTVHASSRGNVTVVQM